MKEANERPSVEAVQEILDELETALRQQRAHEGSDGSRELVSAAHPEEE